MTAQSPFILQAQITPPLGGGASGLADSTRLENPFQTPMWIDEIRFRLPGGNEGQNWGDLSVELTLDGLRLTRGFVPIGLFGKVLSDAAIVGENGVAGGANKWSPDTFTWKLPKPLFVPARAYLRPVVYYAPSDLAVARTVTIIYVCRPLPKGTPTPRTVQVPWVTHFAPAPLTCPSAADTTDQSTPADLYNPWDEELHVQRFIGRIMAVGDGAAGDGYGENHARMDLASANVSLTTGLITVGTLISAQDSFNNILIRDRTPFAHVFDFIDRAWTVNCKLPPKGFYLFTVDRLWSAFADTFIGTAGISMVGWREVQIQRGFNRFTGRPFP